MRGKKRTDDRPATPSLMRKWGITGKLVIAIVVTIVIMVGGIAFDSPQPRIRRTAGKE